MEFRTRVNVNYVGNKSNKQVSLYDVDNYRYSICISVLADAGRYEMNFMAISTIKRTELLKKEDCCLA